jgi:hypothetical protein
MLWFTEKYKRFWVVGPAMGLGILLHILLDTLTVFYPPELFWPFDNVFALDDFPSLPKIGLDLFVALECACYGIFVLIVKRKMHDKMTTWLKWMAYGLVTVSAILVLTVFVAPWDGFEIAAFGIALLAGLPTAVVALGTSRQAMFPPDARSAHEHGEFIPYNNDYLYRFVNKISRDSSLRLFAFYLVISFGVMNLLGFATGLLPTMYKDWINLFNMGVLAPLGAGLLCYYYNCLRDAVGALADQYRVGPRHTEMRRHLKQFASFYNHPLAFWIALSMGLIVSLYSFYLRTIDGHWLGIDGGVTAFYIRVFITANFTIIALLFWKILVTWTSLLRAFRNDAVHIRPLHPDKVGGIRSIGRLYIAVVYLFVPFMAYFILNRFFDELGESHPTSVLVFAMLYLVILAAFSFPCTTAHRIMLREKEILLMRIEGAFELCNVELMKESQQGRYDINRVDEMLKLQDLYVRVEQMTDWPLDTKGILRVVSAASIPLLLLLVELLVEYVFLK